MEKNKGGGTIIFYTNYGVTMNYEKINAIKDCVQLQTGLELQTELEKILSEEWTCERLKTDTDFGEDEDDEDDRSKAATQLLISRGG